MPAVRVVARHSSWSRSLLPQSILVPRIGAEAVRRLGKTVITALRLLRDIERDAPSLLNSHQFGIAIREKLLAAFSTTLEPVCVAAARQRLENLRRLRFGSTGSGVSGGASW